ncbi:MAG: hypothetical protein HZB56_13580 [Deltaproteobacteria bacterium]|nr:hypothetical protein [Deltaproteobacteria bacterium]
MRAEARAERPAPVGAREASAAGAEGFARALREAEERTATSTSTPTATATSTSTATLTPTLTPTEEGPASRNAEVSARAVAAVAAAREAGQAALVVSAGDGMRYEVAGGAGGVELRIVAPPLLERVARADLHAVAGACDRRGLPLRRATVRVASREGGGGRKR